MSRLAEVWLLAAALLLLPISGPLPGFAPSHNKGQALSGAALAVQPDEILTDPALERRARALSAGLRCLVCQNQSIDDSDADLAKDLRAIVRERLVAGDSDASIRDYIVGRYGEFVLLSPRLSADTLLLWATPIALLLAGGAFALLAAKGRRTRASTPGLTTEEELAVEKALRDKGL